MAVKIGDYFDSLCFSIPYYHGLQIGAEANQAIMLVTDGVPYTYETIFQVISNFIHFQVDDNIFDYFRSTISPTSQSEYSPTSLAEKFQT